MTNIKEGTPLLLKVAYRGDGEHVTAYVALIDGSEDVWERFKDLMRDAGFHVIEAHRGGKITGHEEMPPELLEGGGRES